MRLKTLEMENFGLFKKESVDFLRFKTNKVLILGENRDEEGADSNGSGKTSLLDAICWAISGFTHHRKKIGVEQVIGPFSDTCSVTLEMSGRFDIKIKRTRASKLSLEFWINGEPKHTRGDSNKTQTTLLYYLGIHQDFQREWFDDFRDTTYFSRQIARVFTDSTSTPTDKFNFISRFLALRILDLCKENAKKKLDKVDGEIKIVSSKIEVIDQRLESVDDIKTIKSRVKINNTILEEHRDALLSLQNQLNTIHEANKLNNSIESKLSIIESKSEELSNRINDLKNLYENKKKDYEEADLNKKEAKELAKKIELMNISKKYEILEKSQDEINSLLNSIAASLSWLERNDEKLKDLQAQLTEPFKCPVCKTELMIKEKHLHQVDLNAIETKIKKLELDGKKLQEQYKLNETRKEELTRNLQEIKISIEQYNKLKLNLNSLEVKSSNKEIILEELNKIIEQKNTWEKTAKEYIESIDNELKNEQTKLKALGQVITLEDYQKQNKDLNDQITQISDNIARDNFMLSKLEEEKEELKKLKLTLSQLIESAKGFKFAVEGFPTIRKWRIDNFIPEFRTEINTYMNFLRSNIKVVMDTEKETKKGTIRDEFPIMGIDQHGNLRPFETFSEGERARISFSIAMALKSLVEKDSYMPFQFIMMDEVADGLDQTGVSFLSNFIDQSNDDYYIISHFENFKEKFSEKILVIRENGRSTIKITTA